MAGRESRGMDQGIVRAVKPGSSLGSWHREDHLKKVFKVSVAPLLASFLILLLFSCLHLHTWLEVLCMCRHCILGWRNGHSKSSRRPNKVRASTVIGKCTTATSYLGNAPWSLESKTRYKSLCEYIMEASLEAGMFLSLSCQSAGCSPGLQEDEWERLWCL